MLSLWVAVRRGFDILHACNPPETYFALGLFYKLFGKKFIFDHHDLSPEMYVAKGGKLNGMLYQILLRLERLTFFAADVVVTTNQSHRRLAMQRGRVPEENIFIVRSGPGFSTVAAAATRAALKDGFRYLICYLGEMCTQDGVDYMLKAAQTLITKHGRQDLKFVLMGGGPDLQRLRQMKSEMGLDGYVDFTGRVSDTDLCRYLSTADICIDPDPFTEWSDQSTMNKIMEYMAFAKPVVAFDLRENHHRARSGTLCDAQ
ncbi:MAG: glycosyltransferase [Caldilineaceae bacterium]